MRVLTWVDVRTPYRNITDGWTYAVIVLLLTSDFRQVGILDLETRKFGEDPRRRDVE